MVEKRGDHRPRNRHRGVAATVAATKAGAATSSGAATAPARRSRSLALATALALAAGPVRAGGRLLTVCPAGCEHTTVQGAIDAARPGDTVRVARGIYRESIRIDKDLALQGDGAGETVLDGNGPTTVVTIGEGAAVEISGVTVTNGVGSSGGTGNDAGGIYNRGTLVLTRTVVEGNSAPEGAGGRGKGGGIRNDGTLAVSLGFIGDNSAAGRGGGVYNQGVLAMDGVTLCGNTASNGGALFNEGEAILTRCLLAGNRTGGEGGGVANEDRCLLTNCTLSGNEAGGDGGGVWAGGMRVPRVETVLTHCTVTDNRAPRGAGVTSTARTPVDLAATIVARNDRGSDCAGAIRSLGYNLDGDDSCGLARGGEKPDRPASDLRLSQLGYHDGPTLTHALLEGSPAVDLGSAPCGAAADQRGVLRPAGGGCDSGAFERRDCSPVPAARFTRGDANGDRRVDLSDAVSVLLFLYRGSALLACADAGDADDDGRLLLSDALVVLNWLFRGGRPLPEPLACGADPTADDLDCLSPPPCADEAPARYQGLWTSAAELAAKPLSGPAWEAVRAAAEEACAGEATVANQDSNTNVQILAAGIAYARLSAEEPALAGPYRGKVVAALEKLLAEGDPRAAHGCPFGCGKAANETLAWGRETGAYVLAADLVGYRTPELEAWARNMAESYVACDGRTLLESFERRPNNWGAMSFGSLVAIYAYLGDTPALERLRSYFVLGLTGGIPDCAVVAAGEPCAIWGGSTDPGDKDFTWHCDPGRPAFISPDCSLRLPDSTVIELGGLIPDDQRRACSLCPPGWTAGICGSLPESERCVRPEADPHITDWMNGAVMGARILDRIGMGLWDVAGQAFKRMVLAHLVTHCQLTCDDEGFRCESLYNCKDWVIPILDEAYDLRGELSPPPVTDCDCPLEVAGRGTGASKNAGFGAYVVP